MDYIIKLVKEFKDTDMAYMGKMVVTEDLKIHFYNYSWEVQVFIFYTLFLEAKTDEEIKRNVEFMLKNAREYYIVREKGEAWKHTYFATELQENLSL